MKLFKKLMLKLDIIKWKMELTYYRIFNIVCAVIFNDKNAQCDLGDYFLYGDLVRMNVKNAFYWYNRVIQSNEKSVVAKGYYKIGMMYYNGIHVKQDSKEALKWFELSSSKCYGRAKYMLGIMYEYGRGVKQDWNSALQYYASARLLGIRCAESSVMLLQKKMKDVDRKVCE